MNYLIIILSLNNYKTIDILLKRIIELILEEKIDSRLTIWISGAVNVELLALLAGRFPSGWRLIPDTFVFFFYIPTWGSNFGFIILSNLCSIYVTRIRADLKTEDQIYIRFVELYCSDLIGNISNIKDALQRFWIHPSPY